MKYGSYFRSIDSALSTDYANPNDLGLMERQLHVCESLFGDWNAQVCFLMQDAADVGSLQKFHERTGRPILSHSPGAQTNRRLVSWVRKYEEFSAVSVDGANARNCGIYYANAVWFLKRRGGMGAALPQRALAIRASIPILETTFQQMPNLELIIAFGEVAYLSLKEMFGLKQRWAGVRESEDLITSGKYLIGVTWHPKARGVPMSVMESRLDKLLSMWKKAKANMGEYEISLSN